MDIRKARLCIRGFGTYLFFPRIHDKLWIMNYEWWIMNYELRITNYELRVMKCNKLQIANWKYWIWITIEIQMWKNQVVRYELRSIYRELYIHKSWNMKCNKSIILDWCRTNLWTSIFDYPTNTNDFWPHLK